MKDRYAWCRCGRRRVFVAHELMSRLKRGGIWFDDVPPHRFEQEHSEVRIAEFEQVEKDVLSGWEDWGSYVRSENDKAAEKEKA